MTSDTYGFSGTIVTHDESEGSVELDGFAACVVKGANAVR